jgi:hypothetical protein
MEDDGPMVDILKTLQGKHDNRNRKRCGNWNQCCEITRGQLGLLDENNAHQSDGGGEPHA